LKEVVRLALPLNTLSVCIYQRLRLR